MLYEFSNFALDTSKRQLTRLGEVVPLAPKTFDMLLLLLESDGRVLTKSELMRALWPDTFVEEANLSFQVSTLRKALGDDGAKWIETVPKHGYRFIAPVSSTATEARKTRSALHAGSAVKDAEQTREITSVHNPGQVRRVATRLTSRWWTALALTVAASIGGTWWMQQSKSPRLIDGSISSKRSEANDQYNLAFSFLAFQSDIPRARKTFERALELDPDFVSARLQRALAIILEIYTGYANDESVVYDAESEVHRAEQVLPASEGLLLSAQAAVYLTQGRLDRVPTEKLEQFWRKGGNPTWLIVLRLLQGKTEETPSILRAWIDRQPLENPSRMLLGEFLRTQGDTDGAIRSLQVALQQAPRNIVAASFLALAYLDGAKPEQARKLLEGMRPEFERNYVWRHAWAILLAAEGRRDEALQTMDEATLKFARLAWQATSPTADFYALIGEHRKSIEWLQLSISRGDERVSYFRRNPRLAPLRNEMSFQSLLKSVDARRR